MTEFWVDTESGSRYRIDTERMTMKRVPRVVRPVNDPNVIALDLRGDGEELSLLSVEFEVGRPLRAVCEQDGKPFFRLSTTVTAVKEIDVPTGADQPA